MIIPRLHIMFTS